MVDILHSNPLIQLYFLYVAALAIAFFWPRPSKPPVSKRAAGGAGPNGDPSPPDVRGGRPALPSSRLRWDSAAYCLLPVRELTASCSAEYAARFAQATKRIRIH
jgi:hypothetical protein